MTSQEMLAKWQELANASGVEACLAEIRNTAVATDDTETCKVALIALVQGAFLDVQKQRRMAELLESGYGAGDAADTPELAELRRSAAELDSALQGKLEALTAAEPLEHVLGQITGQSEELDRRIAVLEELKEQLKTRLGEIRRKLQDMQV